MAKWFPTLLAVLGLLAPAISPTVQHFWAAHPLLASSVVSALAVINHFLPSPLSPPKG